MTFVYGSHVCNGCSRQYTPVVCHSCNALDNRFCSKCHNRGNTQLHRYKEPILDYARIVCSLFMVSALSLGWLIIGSIH